MTPVATLVARLRVVSLACHALLLAGLPLAAGVTGGLLALPLLAPVRGLWLGRAYTYAWCSMLIVFYTGAFLMEASFQPARRPLALLFALVAAVEFCALVLFVRVDAASRRP